MRFVLAAAAAAVLAGATAAVAAAPAFDKAEGAGTYGPGCFTTAPIVTDPGTFCFGFERRFSFSAQQLGFGGRANGFYTHERTNPSGGNRFTARVTCLNVAGNAAVFGGVVTAGLPQPNGEPSVGEPFVVWVVDNGNASDGDPPDLISPFAFFPDDDPDRHLVPTALPNVCPQPTPSLYGYLPLTSGNIVVDDRAPGVGLTP